VKREFTEIHMGMPVRIVLHAETDSAARAAARAAFRTIATLENVLSDYRAFSELRQLELRAGEWVRVSADLFAVLQTALTVSRATDGAFDPTVGPLTSVWRAARRAGKVPEQNSIQSARRLVGVRHVRLDSANQAVRLALPGMRIDLGGIAKGYILQRALHILRDGGSPSALIEAGGDIVVSAAPPGQAGWRIATPATDSAFRARAAALSHGALATSGSSAQFLEVAGVRYSHIIDPRTGTPVTNTYHAHVIAADAALADALATALTVLGPQAVPRLSAVFADALLSVRNEPHR
jgi:thiamine biosynthesis lipoprotein